MSIVTVLTPNGRRQAVRCSANQTCMHILEEVCRKHTDFAPVDFELVHHRRVLDLTQMFRFAGLPNNAQLEMQATTKQRSVDADVTLMLQLESGERVQGAFRPDTNVDQVVRQLCPAEADRADLVCVYMRTEIWGERLRATTLRSLGLTGGRAAIRLMHKSPESLRVQANVSAPLAARPSPIELVVAERPAALPMAVQVKSEPVAERPVVVAPTPHAMDVDVVEAAPMAASPAKSSLAASAASPAKCSPSPVEHKKPKIEAAAAVEKQPVVVDAPPIVHRIGQHSAIVFSLDDRPATTADRFGSVSDDSFYDVSVSDLKVLLRDLRCEARGNDDAPLLTTKLRELEEAQRTLLKIGRYKRTVIRVQFADRLVLQGQFSPVDAVRTVCDWVRAFLSDPQAEVQLFTTPPKHVLDVELTLVEANCVPTAVLHLAAPARLASRFTDRLSSPSAAVLDASNWLNVKTAEAVSGGTAADDSAPLDDRRGACGGQSPDENRQRSAGRTGGQFKTSATANNEGGAKLPKWFKPIGK